MAVNKTTLNLLAYDIADPKRLTRVHRTVRGYGMPLQYSVFLIPGTAATIDALLNELAAIIEPALDDIRVYPLPARPDAVHYGRQWLAEGVQLLGDSVFEQALTSLAQQTVKS